MCSSKKAKKYHKQIQTAYKCSAFISHLLSMSKIHLSGCKLDSSYYQNQKAAFLNLCEITFSKYLTRPVLKQVTYSLYVVLSNFISFIALPVYTSKTLKNMQYHQKYIYAMSEMIY